MCFLIRGWLSSIANTYRVGKWIKTKRKEAESVKQIHNTASLSYWFIVYQGCCVKECEKPPNMLLTVCQHILNMSSFPPCSLLSLLSRLTSASKQAVLSGLSVFFFSFFMNRNTKLEECGAGFGSKTPRRQESERWVRRLIVCPTLHENCRLAVRVSLRWSEVRVCLCSQTRSRCWWCGTARCRWRSKTWRDTARKESRSQPKWESSSTMTEPVCFILFTTCFWFMAIFI